MQLNILIENYQLMRISPYLQFICAYNKVVLTNKQKFIRNGTVTTMIYLKNSTNFFL